MVSQAFGHLSISPNWPLTQLSALQFLLLSVPPTSCAPSSLRAWCIFRLLRESYFSPNTILLWSHLLPSTYPSCFGWRANFLAFPIPPVWLKPIFPCSHHSQSSSTYWLSALCQALRTESHLGRWLWGPQYTEHVLERGIMTQVGTCPCLQRPVAQCRRAWTEEGPLVQVRDLLVTGSSPEKASNEECEWRAGSSCFSGRTGKEVSRYRPILGWGNEKFMWFPCLSPDFQWRWR